MLDDMSQQIEQGPLRESVGGAAVRELIGRGYRALEDFQSAQPHYEKSYQLRREHLGADHRDTLRSQHWLGVACSENGNSDQAATCFRQVLDHLRRSGESPSYLDNTLRYLAAIYRRQKKYADAEPLFAEYVELWSREPSEPANLWTGIQDLAAVREALSKFAEAEPLRVKLVECGRQGGKGIVEFHTALADLGWNQLQQQKYDEAESPLRECLKICEQNHRNHWIRFEATSLLGAALAGQKKFAEAEPLLISGYEGLQSHQADLPWDGRPRVTNAMGRLVQLYDAWDKKNKADEWRKTLKEAQAAPQPPAQP